MKKAKSLICIFIALLLTLTIFIPVFAVSEKDKSTEVPAPAPQEEGSVSDSAEKPAGKLKVTTEKAKNIALTAAKSKYAIEGISADISDSADVTKLKYNKKSGSYAVTIRAKRIHKYTCEISVKQFLGAEIGMPENSEYVLQGKVSAFFGQGAEKFSYFFIKLFGQDGPKK